EQYRSQSGYHQRDDNPANSFGRADQRPSIDKSGIAVHRICVIRTEDSLCNDGRAIRQRKQDQNLRERYIVHDAHCTADSSGAALGAMHGTPSRRVTSGQAIVQSRENWLRFALFRVANYLKDPRAPCTARNGYVMNKKMNKKFKSIPKFRSEAEERRFWQTHDSSDYIDWAKAERVRFPNLRPSTTAISLRLPVTLLERIKVAANKRDVPYQSLIKTWLAEKTGTR